MVIQNNYCRGWDSEIKNSVKLGDVWEKCPIIIVLWHCNTNFEGGVMVWGKSRRNTLGSNVQDFSTEHPPPGSNFLIPEF